MNFTKQILKKLAQAVGEVLNQNEYANEMNALIDFGEWSQSEPDFIYLVESWNLDKETLWEMIKKADDYANRHFLKTPSLRYTSPKAIYKYGPYKTNPWIEVRDLLGTLRETFQP